MSPYAPAEPEALLSLDEALPRLEAPIFVFGDRAAIAVRAGDRRVDAFDPPATVDRLGGAAFRADHRLSAPYVLGSMTQGIASADLVEAAARQGLLAFFGSGGLPLEAVDAAIARLRALGERPWGVNLINNPMHPGYEDAMVDRLLAGGVRTIEASAYMSITPGLVRFRLAGLRAEGDRIRAERRIIAKVSREELAEQFWAPPPPAIVESLRAKGQIDGETAALAARIPLAEDLIAEADSGGHTDKRSALLLFPTLAVLRDQLARQHGHALRLGAAGGIATPQTVLAAFTLGADFVSTGSINQACVESGTTPFVKALLAEASMTDVAMAPAADMFEMGVKVQVLTRGLMFHTKARRLEELYLAHESLDALPAAQREFLEKRVFKRGIEEVWDETRRFFERVDPRVLEKAATSPKLKMALVFRWYLGLSSKWPREPDLSRKVDFQIWCGPAMGAFNRWAKGSYLEAPENRRVAAVARELIDGALYLDRVRNLARQGVALPPALREARPRYAP